WAERYHFPMAPYDREDLAQVAQYLAVNQGLTFPKGALIEYLYEETRKRHAIDLSNDLMQGTSSDELQLNRLMGAVDAQWRSRSPTEPHQVLANLPFPIYLTTSPDNMLFDALVEAGRNPEVDVCRWNDQTLRLPSVFDEKPGYRPDPQHPLIY